MKKNYRDRYSKELLKQIIKESRSKSQVLTKLELPVTASRLRSISRLIQEYKISTAHFKGQAWSQGLPSCHTHTTKSLYRDVFKLNGAHHTGFRLRRWMLLLKVCEDRCAICKMFAIWRGQPIALEVDHINGNHYDNRLKNLRLLCPNCHAQTPTYGEKNKAGYSIKPAHGTYRRYWSTHYKCRCKKCRSANAAYVREYKQKHRKPKNGN